jgi:hypothetical protein
LENQSDESDATFRIVTAESSLTVVFPNGGERWARGSRQLIQWKSQILTGSGYQLEVRLKDVSNPQNEHVLLSNTPNDRAEFIVVPETIPPGSYILEIAATHAGEEIISDASNGPINIGGPIFNRLDITSGVFPAGEELSFVVSASTAHDEVVAFTVYPLPEGARLLPIGDVSMNGVLSALDGNRINQFLAGTLTLTPTQKLLADFNRDGQISQEDADLLLRAVVELIKPTPAVVFVWTPTNSQIGPQSMSFIASGSMSKETDQIMLQLQIEPRLSLAILSPNGDEEWPVNSTQMIRWSGTTPDSDNVLISLSLIRLDGAIMRSDLPWSTQNDGSESWTIPTWLGVGEYRIRIACIVNCTMFKIKSDESDAVFRVVPAPSP